jgi:hypothetical protein
MPPLSRAPDDYMDGIATPSSTLSSVDPEACSGIDTSKIGVCVHIVVKGARQGRHVRERSKLQRKVESVRFRIENGLPYYRNDEYSD